MATNTTLDISMSIPNSTAVGTGTAKNVQGSKNFTLMVYALGTGTASGRMKVSANGTDWLTLTTGTAISLDGSTVTTHSTLSNKAYSQALVTVGLVGTIESTAEAKAWIFAN